MERGRYGKINAVCDAREVFGNLPMKWAELRKYVYSADAKEIRIEVDYLARGRVRRFIANRYRKVCGWESAAGGSGCFRYVLVFSNVERVRDDVTEYQVHQGIRSGWETALDIQKVAFLDHEDGWQRFLLHSRAGGYLEFCYKSLNAWKQPVEFVASQLSSRIAEWIDTATATGEHAQLLGFLSACDYDRSEIVRIMQLDDNRELRIDLDYVGGLSLREWFRDFFRPRELMPSIRLMLTFMDIEMLSDSVQDMNVRGGAREAGGEIHIDMDEVRIIREADDRKRFIIVGEDATMEFRYGDLRIEPMSEQLAGLINLPG